VNELFYRVFAAERALLVRGATLPFGLSILAAGRNPANPGTAP
jgi:hypothetical protein